MRWLDRVVLVFDSLERVSTTVRPVLPVAPTMRIVGGIIGK